MVVVVWPLSLSMPLVGHLLFAEAFQQQTAGFVVAHHSNGQHLHAQRGQIHHGVGAAARDHGALAMFQDQHRRFARDPCDLAEDEFVGHQVGEDGDRYVAKMTWTIFFQRSVSFRCLFMNSNEVRPLPQLGVKTREPANFDCLTRPLLRSAIVASMDQRRTARPTACGPAPRERLQGLQASPRFIASFSVVTKAARRPAVAVAATPGHRYPCSHGDRESSGAGQLHSGGLQLGEEVLRSGDAAEAEARLLVRRTMPRSTRQTRCLVRPSPSAESSLVRTIASARDSDDSGSRRLPAGSK